MSGPSGSATCEAFVEALGLKTLFPVLMSKVRFFEIIYCKSLFTLRQSQSHKKQKGNPVLPASEDTSHILGIISSLLTNLASDSPFRIRLLAKFVENNYEKVDRLLDIRDHAHALLKLADADIERERKVHEYVLVLLTRNDIHHRVLESHVGRRNQYRRAWHVVSTKT